MSLDRDCIIDCESVNVLLINLSLICIFCMSKIIRLPSFDTTHELLAFGLLILAVMKKFAKDSVVSKVFNNLLEG